MGSTHHPFMHQDKIDGHEELSIYPKAESESHIICPARACLSGGRQFAPINGQIIGEGRSTQNWLKGVISSKLNLRLADCSCTTKLHAGPLHLNFSDSHSLP